MRKWRKNNPEKYAIELKRNKEYREKHREYMDKYNKEYYQLNSVKIKEQTKNYRETNKGRLVDLAHTHKRKRNLGFILMFPNPFDNSVLVDYHHITDVYVIAVPRELHELYLGKYHREKVMGIVKQIYM